jgi:hypothetical protein
MVFQPEPGLFNDKQAPARRRHFPQNPPLFYIELVEQEQEIC